MRKKIEKIKPEPKFRREFSAGGVVYKKCREKRPVKLGRGVNEKGKVKWLIGKHSGYQKWVLPKGLIEKGEKGFETAVREVEEEMGVKASLVSRKPIHKVQYVYWADFKQGRKGSKSSPSSTEREVSDISYQQSDEMKLRRRVAKYQEAGGKKVKVFKVVSFFLMQYKSGDPKDHDWEMSEAGWFSYQEAKERLAFKGEKEALEIAHDKICLRIKN